MIFGGKGANQAVAAARSVGRVAFITKVGDDIFGARMKTHFQEEGLPSACILTDAEEPTGIAQIFVSEKGENSIAVAPGANMRLLPADLQPFERLLASAGVILVQLEIPLETVEYIAELAARNGSKLILNPAPAQALSGDLLQKIWLLTPNESEATLLTGIPVHDRASAQQAGEALLRQGVGQVIITLGENGCLLCQAAGVRHFAAFPATAVDTTAAGDVFNGALAVAITQHQPFDAAIPFASAAAAISVGRNGAQTSIPYLAEIQALLHP